MIERFITRRDSSGNRYTLIIDTDHRLYWRDINLRNTTGFIEITKKARQALIDQLCNEGYQDITN